MANGKPTTRAVHNINRAAQQAKLRTAKTGKRAGKKRVFRGTQRGGVVLDENTFLFNNIEYCPLSNIKAKTTLLNNTEFVVAYNTSSESYIIYVKHDKLATNIPLEYNGKTEFDKDELSSTLQHFFNDEDDIKYIRNCPKPRDSKCTPNVCKPDTSSAAATAEGAQPKKKPVPAPRPPQTLLKQKSPPKSPPKLSGNTFNPFSELSMKPQTQSLQPPKPPLPPVSNQEVPLPPVAAPRRRRSPPKRPSPPPKPPLLPVSNQEEPLPPVAAPRRRVSSPKQTPPPPKPHLPTSAATYPHQGAAPTYTELNQYADNEQTHATGKEVRANRRRPTANQIINGITETDTDTETNPNPFFTGLVNFDTKGAPTNSATFVLEPNDKSTLASDYVFICKPETEATQNNTTVYPVNESNKQKHKNRYANIPAYDYTRVILNHTTDNPHGYINANFITFEDGGNQKYIATQGPLPNTISDFWQMIDEQKPSVICMVTNLVEGGRVKCADYFTDKIKQGSKIETIKLTNSTTNPDAIIEIRDLESPHGRKVKHVWFHAWPDHGVPQHTEDLVVLSNLINRFCNNCPPVIHCSAGVGRTGTIIAINHILSLPNQEPGRLVDVMKRVLREMRTKRIAMIQTVGQYECVYKTIANNKPHEHVNQSIVATQASFAVLPPPRYPGGAQGGPSLAPSVSRPSPAYPVSRYQGAQGHDPLSPSVSRPPPAYPSGIPTTSGATASSQLALNTSYETTFATVFNQYINGHNIPNRKIIALIGLKGSDNKHKFYIVKAKKKEGLVDRTDIEFEKKGKVLSFEVPDNPENIDLKKNKLYITNYLPDDNIPYMLFIGTGKKNNVRTRGLKPFKLLNGQFSDNIFLNLTEEFDITKLSDVEFYTPGKKQKGGARTLTRRVKGTSTGTMKRRHGAHKTTHKRKHRAIARKTTMKATNW
jgi:protein tyrosine phosphatase